jgi:hypothetical protein
MRVTLNFFYLGKSFILVQRSLILSIIVCSVFFSGCALEEPEKETSSNSPSEGASLYSTILQELETNLSSTNSGRSHQITSSAKTSVSTSLSSSQISAVVEAARQAILEKSLQDNENIGDLYPEILQATLAKLGALNLSSNETVKAISAINWSLLKSSKSRTSQNQETNKNTVENILTIISEKSFSNMDDAGLEISDVSSASSEIIETLIGNLDQTDISIQQLESVVEQINASAVGSLDNISGMDLDRLDSIIQSITGKAVDSLDLIQVSGVELDNLTTLAGSITSGTIKALGGVSSVSGFSVDNVTSLSKNIVFSATSALDQIQMSGYDSTVLEKMIENISSSATFGLSQISMEGYEVSQMALALEASIEGATSALDEIQGDSSTSRSSNKISNYGPEKLGSMLEKITASATGALGEIEMENFSADNLTLLTEKITLGATSGLNEISMEGFSSDNVSDLLGKITEGMVSAIDDIKRDDYSKKQYKKMVRKVTKTATKAIKKLKIQGLTAKKIKKMVRKITSGATKGLKKVDVGDNSTELTMLVTQAVSGVNASIEEPNFIEDLKLTDSLTKSSLKDETKEGGKEGVETLEEVNIDFTSIDLDSPNLSSINPGNNDSDVDENSEVSVTFSEAMEQGSINSATFIVSIGGEHIDGAITTTSTKSVFRASKGLGSGKEHRVRLKLDEITDLAGNPLESSLLGDTWYFTTKDSTPPTVVFISPKDNSESVRIDTEIEIRFSESIDKDSLTTNGCSGSLKISSDDFKNCSAIDQVFWNSENTLVAITLPELESDKTYKIKIGQTLRDIAKNSIQEAFSSQFKTEPENNDSTDAVSETNSSRGCSLSTSLSDNNSVIKFNKIYSDWKGSALQAVQDEECGFVVSGNSSNKAWFAKVDKEGEPRGQKSYDLSTPFGGPDAMIKTSDGGYLSAYSHGLIKVDKDLNFKWKNTKKLHGQIPPSYKDVIESSDGFYAVTEWHGEKGPALVKISKQGKIQKTVRYPSKCKFNDLNALVETDDGDLIMSGSVVHGNSGYPCSFSWLTNLWILKVNKSGKVKWQKSYGCIPKGKKCSHNWEEANDMIKTDDGYAIVGNKHNYISNPNKVLWFLKINESGTILNQYTRSNIHFYDEPLITPTSRGGYVWKTRHKTKGSWLHRPKNQNESAFTLLSKDFYFSDLNLAKDGGFILPTYNGLVKTDSNLSFPESKDNDTSIIGLPSEYGKKEQTDIINTADDTITLECDGSSTSSSSFQFCPEKGASVWRMVKNKKDSGYALVGGKDKRPWIRIVDENGNNKISKTYDEFGDYKSSFGNGLPAEGQLDGSAISQTEDGGYIVGTYVNPRHPSYGYSHVFKTDSQGSIQWKRELKYKSGKTKVIHFIQDIIQTNDGDFVAVGYTSGDSGNKIKGQGFMTKINKDDGSEKWMKRFGSNVCVFDTLDSVLEDSDNNLVAVGKYEKPCPGYKCHHGYACGDVWLLKINPDDGSKVFEKRHAYKRSASGHSLLKLNDGSFIVGGRIKESKNTPVNSAVWRISQNGDLVWSEPWTGSARKEKNDWHNEHVNALALNSQGDAILAAGWTGLANIRKAQKFDMMVWSMDLNGNQKWIKRYVESGKQSASSITPLSNNHFLLSGGSWFFEIDSDGNLKKIHK